LQLDVAARGLDISELPMVINHEIPSAPEDYVIPWLVKIGRGALAYYFFELFQKKKVFC
jgi:superfamily II DNA/RNA helicase